MNQWREGGKGGKSTVRREEVVNNQIGVCTYRNATGIGNVGQSHVWCPGHTLHHVLMASQLSLTLLGGCHPHTNGLGKTETNPHLSYLFHTAVCAINTLLHHITYMYLPGHWSSSLGENLKNKIISIL